MRGANETVRMNPQEVFTGATEETEELIAGFKTSVGLDTGVVVAVVSSPVPGAAGKGAEREGSA